MRIYNTLSRRLEEFSPILGNSVRMYTCGPTVYNYAHIGNYRAYVFEDLLRRYLKYCGYAVTQVMNLTDVDDKTIRGSRESGVSLDAYTGKYKAAFFADLKDLNIEKAEHYPAATDHIDDMISMIRRLFDAGYAYKSSDGSVYFDIGKFRDYGKLAHLDRSGMRAGARVAQDEYDKENAVDFALWKAWSEEDGDVGWESPWGRGRPGWHIECSAMSTRYLGESFDLHTGGIDNMFPHHENEIAQTEAATGKPFVKYWMHCGYLVVDGRKMSKSLGNFHTLREIVEKGYSGREVRYVLLSAHYRQELNFTLSALDAARASLARLDEFSARLSAGEPKGEMPDWCSETRRKFRVALDDDLNTPEALSALFEMVHHGNREIDAGRASPGQTAHATAALADFDRVLGFLGGVTEQPDATVLEMAELRRKARQSKNWSESDRLRDKIASLGWEVRDTAEGQQLKRLSSTR